MDELAKRLLQEALALPVEERRRLVDAIEESFEPADPEWEQAWHAELDRRLASMRRGEEEPLSLDQVRQRLSTLTSR